MILLVVVACGWIMYKGYCQSYKHQQALLAEAMSRRSDRAAVEVEIGPTSHPAEKRREVILAEARKEALNGKRQGA